MDSNGYIKLQWTAPASAAAKTRHDEFLLNMQVYRDGKLYANRDCPWEIIV